MKFVKLLEDQRVKEGCKATFVCVVNIRKATVNWYKNDLKLRQSSKYLISSQPVGVNEQEHTLVIPDMRPDDGATISAKAAVKGCGEDKTTATLQFSPEGKLLFVILLIKKKVQVFLHLL